MDVRESIKNLIREALLGLGLDASVEVHFTYGCNNND